MNHTSEKFTTYLKYQLTRKQFGPNEWNFKPSTIISDILAKATMVIAEEHECPQQCFFFFVSLDLSSHQKKEDQWQFRKKELNSEPFYQALAS